MKLQIGDRVLLRPIWAYRVRSPWEQGEIVHMWTEPGDTGTIQYLGVVLDKRYWTKHPKEDGYREVPKSQVHSRLAK